MNRQHAAPSPREGQHAGPPPRGGTRDRIQSVALELFAEQGYERTSLREIAERLEVTKAALYYHFKSKEDIVASLVSDYFRQIDELTEWGRSQPRSARTRRELLESYFRIVRDSAEVFRMIQQNQAVLGIHADAKHRGELFRERMDGLVEVLAGPDPTLPAQVRAASALMSVSFGCMFYAARARSPAELEDAVLSVALDLADATADG